ncbi:uncharacterized protein FA14DRAFT_153839 [Meira miltonrushii]|uniref:Uncharacterized protein n=1 Tax=Meira miltonrushii TaxID=1280837 RepID=A0A316VLW7_9BASI|nr:uncharacterized protein FA14DRAFT_153839 [Meira miltonrushii]PWN38517.1 hypothetical protein FA14DRAFT_153839 [Meira miltonrushii]
MSIPIIRTLVIAYFCLLPHKFILCEDCISAGGCADFTTLKKRQSDESSSQSSSRSRSAKRKEREADLSSKGGKRSSSSRPLQDQLQSSRTATSHKKPKIQNFIDRVGVSESSSSMHAQTQISSHERPSTMSLDLSLGGARSHASTSVQKDARNSASPPASSSFDATQDTAHRDTTHIKPFSSDVLRGARGGKKPAGYDTRAQKIARYTEKYLKAGETKKEAVQKANNEYAQRTRRNREDWKAWREIVRTDPSRAREMTTQVPKRMGRSDYIRLRTHQLLSRGMTADINEAIRIAREENDQQLSHRRNYSKTFVRKNKRP